MGQFRSKRSWRALVAAASLVGCTAALAGPSAEAVGTAGLAVSATAMLPQFPCFLQNGPCASDVAGTVTGPLAGTSPVGAWAVSLDAAALDGSLTYVHGIDCLSGNGGGTFTVTATEGEGLLAGALSTGEVVGFRLRADYTLTQSGLQAEIIVANVSVALDVAGQGWVDVATGLKGAGATTYLPSAGALDPERCEWVLGGTPGPADVDLLGTIALGGA